MSTVVSVITPVVFSREAERYLSEGLLIATSGIAMNDGICTLSEKRVLQWFFKMAKSSTWNLLLSEPG